MSAGSAPVPSPENGNVADNSKEAVTPPLKTERTPEQIKRDLEFFNDHKRQVWSDMQAGSDEFDRGLMTLSAGALALSLAFIKDIVSLEHAIHLPLLFASWISFAVCIIVTLTSFRFSVVAQERHLEFARLFYIEGDYTKTERHWCAKALTWCTYIAGSALVIGFALTIWFAVTNVIAEKVRKMKKDDKAEIHTLTQDARAPINVIVSQAPEERGRQPVPLTVSDTLEKGRQPVAPIVTTPTNTGTQTGGPGSGNSTGTQTEGSGMGNSGQQNSGEKK